MKYIVRGRIRRASRGSRRMRDIRAPGSCWNTPLNTSPPACSSGESRSPDSRWDGDDEACTAPRMRRDRGRCPGVRRRSPCGDRRPMGDSSGEAVGWTCHAAVSYRGLESRSVHIHGDREPEGMSAPRSGDGGRIGFRPGPSEILARDAHRQHLEPANDRNYNHRDDQASAGCPARSLKIATLAWRSRKDRGNADECRR